MRNIKMMDLNVEEVTLRFYLMMAGTIILGFLGQFFWAAIWAFTLSVSFILAVSFRTQEENKMEDKSEKTESKVIQLKEKEDLQEVG